MDVGSADADACAVVYVHPVVPVISFDDVFVTLLVEVDQKHGEIERICLQLSHHHREFVTLAQEVEFPPQLAVVRFEVGRIESLAHTLRYVFGGRDYFLNLFVVQQRFTLRGVICRRIHCSFSCKS